MATHIERTQNENRPPIPQAGTLIGSAISDRIVFVNSTVTAHDPLDPHQYLDYFDQAPSGALDGQASINVVNNPDAANYLYLFHEREDATIPTTTPRVRVYGRTEGRGKPTNDGDWVPLYNPNTFSEGTFNHELSTEAVMQLTGRDGVTRYYDGGVMIATLGCSKLLVMVERAAVMATSGEDGQVVGNFVW